MSSNELSLLLKIRGDSAGGKAAVSETRAAIASLRSSTTTDFNAIKNAAGGSLGQITSTLTQVGSQLPVIGGAVSNLTSQFTGLTAVAGTTAGTMGIVAGASVIAASAIGGIAKTLFDVTVKTAEFQGRLFDLSQQTGVNVSTLSALEIAAKTTGSDITAITASLGIFQKNLEDAQTPTSKEAKLLAELGVQSNNTEEALRQTLTQLAAMPEGFQQTATALELFGRGGKAILAILKELDGDLDGAINRFRDLGILVEGDAARAADKFNDQLAIVQFQIRGTAALIGNEAMPEILNAINAFSGVLSDNREVLGTWVNSTADAARGAIVLANAVATITGQVTGLSSIPIPQIISLLGSVTGIPGILQGLRSFGTPAIGPVNIPDVTKAPPIGLPRIPTVTASRGGGGGGGGGAAREAEKQAQQELKLRQKEVEEEFKRHREALERERNFDLVTLEEYTTEASRLNDELFFDQLANFTREEELARKFIKNKEDLRLKLAEIDQARAKAQADNEKKQQDIEDDALRKRERLHLDLNKQLADIREAQRTAELQRLESQLDRGFVAESAALTRQLGMLTEAHEDRLTLIRIESEAESTSAERKTALINEKIVAETEYTSEFERLTQARVDAMAREQAAQVRQPGGVGINPNPLDTSQLGKPPDLTSDLIVGAAAAQGAFNGLGVAISETMGLSQQAGEIVGGVLAQSFSQLAGAVGDAVHSFVLFGSVQGGFKKFAAEMIASIAAMAAVQAVYQLAQGLAWLALNFFFPNPAYAKAAATALASAAVFGSIAGVAAVAGRAVAGDSFSQGGGGGGGKGSGGGTQAAPGKQQSRTIEMDRRMVVEHVHRIEAQPGFIVKEIIKDARNNGDIRKEFSK